MRHSHLPVAAPVEERPLDREGIDRAFIGRLVREFYRRVRRHDRLGTIFAREITGDWEPHLEKMTDFWCSVILKTRSYQGRPVPAHVKLEGVREGDFDIWLSIFSDTAHDLCDLDTASIFVERAERIAQSLKLAMFFRLPAAPGGPVPA